MLERISEGLLAIVNFVPALFVEPDSPHFMLIRGMFALLLFLLIVSLMSMLRPIGAFIGRRMRRQPSGRTEKMD